MSEHQLGARVPDEAPSVDADFQEHGVQRKLDGVALKVLIALALAFSSYQLIVAAYHPLSSLVIRSLHVGFLLGLTFLLYPALKSGSVKSIPWYDWLLAIGALCLATYHWIFEADLVVRAEPSTADMIVGVVTVAMVFEGARRIMGLALPIICAAFLLYGLFGEYFPGALAHRGFGFDQIIGQLYTGTEGIYGIPTMVSATYIFLFILFGAFLEHAGMINLFNNLALGLVGRAKGGPAKVSVLSSGFMGTISGSGVANVLTTGQFTIPLMKRFGYSAKFAGAVEATASMGGQIMPPVMGAVAFIMAETLNVPYIEVVKAAAIPAILYYATAFWMVHLEAGRAGLAGLPKDQCPNPWTALKKDAHLLLPLIALVVMLFSGYTPMFAGMTGLAATAILILGAALAARLSGMAFRIVFWVAVGLGASAFFKFGINAIVALIAVMVAACAVFAGGRQTLRAVRLSLVDGAKQALPVGMACALVGVIIGVLTLTGAASSFAGFIMEVGKGSLFLSLMLTMLVCLLLGMGIPTIPNYIITSSIAAPALLELGVPLIVSHMFVFYFGIMADLTPPVALAAFAAASIAKESAMKIGVKAVQIAVAGFVVPYMAVYSPELMLQGDWTVASVGYVLLKAVIAIGLWGGTAIGYLWIPLNAFERLFAFVAASMLVIATSFTDQIGFVLSAAFLAWHFWQSRRATAAV